jgi:hypothetical protein
LTASAPTAAATHLIEKFLKAGVFAQCPNKECKFKEQLAEAATEAVPA